MTATTAPYRSDLPVGRDSFAQLLRAEWTKFRTVRGWVITAVASALLIVAFAYLGTFRHDAGVCVGSSPSSQSCHAAQPHVPVGPGGEAVTDTFYFMHRTLAGNGSITVRVGSLGGRMQTGSGSGVSTTNLIGASGPVQPWAKAGLILTAGTKPGSAYAAVMLTGAHGVRLQYDYTHDTAGPDVSAAGSRWLRLTRSGTTLTGYESPDGIHWTEVGMVRLAGLPASVPAGLFATSPQTAPASQFASGSSGNDGKATGLTATFDRLSLQGQWAGGAFSGEEVGSGSQMPTLSSVGYHRSGGGFTVTGSGDIAPAVGLPGAYADQQPLTGVFVGLIALIVLGAMFITGEYRRGLIHTTLTASPRRGRVLIAKAVVIATVAFVVGAAAAAVSIPLGNHILRANGNYVYPTSTLTGLRVIFGIGALLALAAVLSLAVGTALRRSAAAVTAVIVLIVVPFVLAFASALPTAVSDWLLRLTPAAAFAVEQTLPQYHQVNYLYAPSGGFYPLAPGLGLAVLIAYTLAALIIARHLLRTRDV